MLYFKNLICIIVCDLLVGTTRLGINTQLPTQNLPTYDGDAKALLSPLYLLLMRAYICEMKLKCEMLANCPLHRYVCWIFKIVSYH